MRIKGAKIVDLEAYGMPPAIILRSDGATLYATRDLAAAKYRNDTYNFDKCLYVVAYQQDLHFRQLFKVLELMGYDWAKDCEHVAFGMVSYEGQTLSTREGRVVYLEDLLHQRHPEGPGHHRGKEPRPGEQGRGRPAGRRRRGGVLRSVQQPHQGHRLLVGSRPQLRGRNRPLRHVHPRPLPAPCCARPRRRQRRPSRTYSALADPEAQEVVRLIEQFPLHSAIRAMERTEPSMITRFSASIWLRRYNKFYYEHKILGEEPGVQAARLRLTDAVRSIIKEALWLISIDAPEKM